MLKKCLIVLLTLGLGVYAPIKPINADYPISEHELNKAADLLKKLIAEGHSHEEIVGMIQSAMEQGEQQGTVLISPTPNDAQRKAKKYYIIGAGIGLATIALLAGGYYAYNYYEQQKKDETARLENEKNARLQKEESARLQEEKQKQGQPIADLQINTKEDQDSSFDKQDIIEVVVEKIENIDGSIKENLESSIPKEEIAKKKHKHKHKHKHHKKDNNQELLAAMPDAVSAAALDNVPQEHIEEISALTKISEKGVIKQKAKDLFGKIQNILNQK
jgi:hypothetical protein